MRDELDDLLIEFDEMGYEPTTLCENPQREAENFKNRLKQALLELKSIKETNPSETLRKLDIIRHLEIGFDKNGKPITLNDTSGLNYIEKALITKSKKEKAFDIVAEKMVDMYRLAVADNVEKYNKWTEFDEYWLTEEEFNLIKEVLKNE